MEKLTNRENQIMSLVSQGYSINEIAKILFINDKTVRTHLRNSYDKLGCFDLGKVETRVVGILNYLKLTGVISADFKIKQTFTGKENG